MTEAKTVCPECGGEFLQSSADSNGGICRKCSPPEKGSKYEEVADKVEGGLRLILAFVFAFVFASAGYGLGVVVWEGVGVLLALFLFPAGFVYGFFCQEINFFVRSIIRAILHIG